MWALSQVVADVWEKDVWDPTSRPSLGAEVLALFSLNPRENRSSKNVWENAWNLQFPNAVVLNAVRRRNTQTLLHFSSAPDPLFKASKAPFFSP